MVWMPSWKPQKVVAGTIAHENCRTTDHGYLGASDYRQRYTKEYLRSDKEAEVRLREIKICISNCVYVRLE